MQDPELACTSEGTAVCRSTAASNRFFKQGTKTRKEVPFRDVTCRAALAGGVRLVGRLMQDRWTDADGKGGESGTAEGHAEAADGQASGKTEMKAAVSFSLPPAAARLLARSGCRTYNQPSPTAGAPPGESRKNRVGQGTGE